MSGSTSRRALLGAIALAPVAAAQIASPAEAHQEGPNPFLAGEASGTEITLCHMARAWIDRWEACGGDFGLVWNRDGGVGAVRLGIVEASFWEPSDRGNEKLPPHLWLTDRRQQSGAKRALEALLEMVPGLQDTVLEIAGYQLLLGRA